LITDAKVMKSIEASTKVNPEIIPGRCLLLENGKDLKQHMSGSQSCRCQSKGLWIYYQKAGLKKHWETRQAHWRPQESGEEATAAKNFADM